MAIVERTLTIPRWASRISVERDGETLVVRGEDRKTAPVPPEQLPRGEDFLQEYLQYSKLWDEKRSGKRPPHIQFANATDDDALIAFIEDFGPVQTHGKLWHLPDRSLTAYQDMQGLRRDRLILSGATKLLVARDRSDASDVLADGLGEICQGVCQPGPATEIHKEPAFRERPWYGNEILPFARWLASHEDIRAEIRPAKLRTLGQIALSILLNCFPPQLHPVGDRMMELPVYDSCGILPALYFMLRQDCLGRQAIAICTLPECGKFFAVERFGQRFCSADCSRLQRQRDYWQRRGKEARARRVASKRSKKGGKRNGTV